LQVIFTHRFVQHRFRPFVALLALALAAFALAACGGDDAGGGGGGGGSADAETLLRQTFTGSHEIRSGRADVQLEITAEGDPSIRGPIEVSLSGPFQSAGRDEIPEFDMALDVSAQGQTFDAGLTSTSDRLFVRFSGTSYEVPGDLLAMLKDSFRRSQQDSGQALDLRSLGLDPIGWLEDPTVEGTETVGGAETEHISAQLDVPALLDDVDAILAAIDRQGLAGATGQDVPDSIPADARRQIEEAVKDGQVDVWTGSEDHTLRRLSLQLTVEPPEGDGGPRSLDLSLTIELADLNEPQTIEAPATSRPLDELLGQFQGLLGGAFGGAGAGGGAAGGGASTEQLDEYTRCIEQAGTDVARAQECADLLTQ
jgi:hypothetical protein